MLGEPSQSDSPPTVVYRISKTGNLESERLDKVHVHRRATTLKVVSLPPVIAPQHMAKPRDPRVNRYLKLQSQRSTHAERLASQTLLRLAKQHDWLNTRSLIPIPRKLLTAEQKATMTVMAGSILRRCARTRGETHAPSMQLATLRHPRCMRSLTDRSFRL